MDALHVVVLSLQGDWVYQGYTFQRPGICGTGKPHEVYQGRAIASLLAMARIWYKRDRGQPLDQMDEITSEFRIFAHDYLARLDPDFAPIYEERAREALADPMGRVLP